MSRLEPAHLTLHDAPELRRILYGIYVLAERLSPADARDLARAWRRRPPP